jgi:hypothetical protein
VRDEQPVEAYLINHHLCNVAYSTSAHGVPTEHFGNLRLTNQNNNDNNEHTLGAEGVLPGRHIVSLLRVFKQFTHWV